MPSRICVIRDCCPPARVSQPGSRHRRTTGGKAIRSVPLRISSKLARETEMRVTHREDVEAGGRLAVELGWPAGAAMASFRGAALPCTRRDCLLLDGGLSRWAARADSSPHRRPACRGFRHGRGSGWRTDRRDQAGYPPLRDRRGEGADPRLQGGRSRAPDHAPLQRHGRTPPAALAHVAARRPVLLFDDLPPGLIAAPPALCTLEERGPQAIDRRAVGRDVWTWIIHISVHE